VDDGVFYVLLCGFVGTSLRCSLGMAYTVCRKRVYTIITVAVIYTDIRFCTSDPQLHVYSLLGVRPKRVLRKNGCVGIESGVMVVCGRSGAKWMGVYLLWCFKKGVKVLVLKYGVFIVEVVSFYIFCVDMEAFIGVDMRPFVLVL